MKDKVLVCIHYVCEKRCKLGKEGTHNKACQKCKSYIPLKGSRPSKTDKRGKKLARIQRREERYD